MKTLLKNQKSVVMIENQAFSASELLSSAILAVKNGLQEEEKQRETSDTVFHVEQLISELPALSGSERELQIKLILSFKRSIINRAVNCEFQFKRVPRGTAKLKAMVKYNNGELITCLGETKRLNAKESAQMEKYMKMQDDGRALNAVQTGILGALMAKSEILDVRSSRLPVEIFLSEYSGSMEVLCKKRYGFVESDVNPDKKMSKILNSVIKAESGLITESNVDVLSQVKFDSTITARSTGKAITRLESKWRSDVKKADKAEIAAAKLANEVNAGKAGKKVDDAKKATKK